MLLRSIEAHSLSIPFKTMFRHASAERRQTQALWITASSHDGSVGFGEGCPRAYVTRESMSTALEFVVRHRAQWLSDLQDLSSIQQWVATHQSEIDANPAAWAAVELSLLDLLGRAGRCSVEKLLGHAELSGRFRYTAVIGEGPADQFAAQLGAYRRQGFRSFKIKLSRDARQNACKTRLLTEAGVAGICVRADANNLWHEAAACVRDLKALNYTFCAVEEPLAAGDFAGMAQVAEEMNTAIVLDESALKAQHLSQARGPAGRWLVNVRVSKMGGLLRSLEAVQAARSLGIGVIIGAHVGETSVLTRAALTLAGVSRDCLIAQEGAFGTHLLSRDVADPPLMFGFGGCIDADKMFLRSGNGFGLSIAHPQCRPAN